MKNLQATYNLWRKEIEDLNKEAEETGNIHLHGTWDCGEAAAREDFSNYAELEEEITFEDMLKLENNYEE
ncbi:MAG: hypothetical protein E6X34_14335 [Clostridium sp.]|uniref:hypothetical protein n=1 Tax=Clostridium sp. TaxID=1506 RepID=UPI00291489B2|nr:hypothetical protein [Clostridium sp.]MDU4939627.1 hypothetical protein [Clostridium sp.]